MWGRVGFFGRIGNTWSLIGTLWDMVKKDKEMLVFPYYYARQSVAPPG